jgi:hypothetical protein
VRAVRTSGSGPGGGFGPGDEFAPGDEFVPNRDVGHYTGANAGGLALSFDVVDEPGSGGVRIENVEADVVAECHDEDDFDAEPRDRIVHLSGLGGRVSADGHFSFEYNPDEETFHDMSGRLAEGKAQAEIAVTGRFGSEGQWQPDGPLNCDSEGDAYAATKQ